MNSLAILKECASKVNPAPIRYTWKNFDQLPLGDYIVTKFVKKDTKHGVRIRITIDNYLMYLPERFSTMTEEVLDDLNKSPKIMTYGGKDANHFNRLIIDFEEATYFDDIFNPDEIFQ